MPGQPVLVVFSFGLFGFFAFALMPVCLEVGVECSYPVAEATSAGLQWMAGYAVDVVCDIVKCFAFVLFFLIMTRVVFHLNVAKPNPE